MAKGLRHVVLQRSGGSMTLSVTDGCRWRGDARSSMPRDRASWLFNIAHSRKFHEPCRRLHRSERRRGPQLRLPITELAPFDTVVVVTTRCGCHIQISEEIMYKF